MFVNAIGPGPAGTPARRSTLGGVEGNGHAKLPSRFGAILRMRCPRCLRGKLFRGVFDMWERCPQCGFVFERESGYFTGAMYASTLITLPLVFGLFGIMWLFSSKTILAAEVLLLVTTLLTLPLIPLVFRYSRTLWLHFDWRFGPDRDQEGPTRTEEFRPNP